MQFKPLLKLVRLPNVLTAACNSLAGAFCAGVGFDRWPALMAIAFSSMSLYAAGILLNDLFDLEEDRRERPFRPLPSGAVPIWLASTLASLFSVVGCLLASSVSRHTGHVALALLASVVSYDAFLKKTPAGPWAMGLCRGLNLALGLAFAPLQAWGIIAVIGYLIYIAGITYISRQETGISKPQIPRAGFYLMVTGITCIITAYLMLANVDSILKNPTDSAVLSVLLCLLIFLTRVKSILASWRSVITAPSPETVQNLVKTGIISLPLFDMLLVLARANKPAALVILAIWITARLTARKLYTT
ncbi:MAG: UbiA family prenyltransferase [bacterium]